MEIFIKSFITQEEGVILELSAKTSLKTGNIVAGQFWVSWDKIGAMLFDNYTQITDVAELNKLRADAEKTVSIPRFTSDFRIPANTPEEKTSDLINALRINAIQAIIRSMVPPNCEGLFITKEVETEDPRFRQFKVNTVF